jgi:hypothetical protein
VRLSRTGDRWFVDWSFRFPADAANDREPAFAVTAWRTGGDLRVLVGTNDYENGGALYLLDPEAAPGNQLLDSTTAFLDPANPPATIQRDVWTIAHAYDLVIDSGTGQPTGEVTALVGLSCNGGLQRYEFTPGATSIPPSSATLLPPASLPPSLGPCKAGDPPFPPNHPRHVRDVVIHHEPGVEQVAFIALRIDGVRAVNLTGGGLAPLGGAVHTSPQFSYPTGLAFDPIDRILFVGCGPYFSEERQTANRITAVAPCGFEEPQSCVDGIHVYSWVSSSSALVFEDAETSTKFLPNDQVLAPVVVGVRRRGTRDYRVDGAATANGLRSLIVADESGFWSFVEAGAMNQFDNLLVVGTNETFLQDGEVYISGEFCIGTFDPAAPGGLLAEPSSVVLVEPANTLAGFGGPAARLYTAGFIGTTIFDVSGANRLLPVKGVNEIPRQGRGLAARTTQGMPLFQGSGGAENRWLIEVNFSDDDAVMHATGGLHVYAVGDATTYTRPTVPEVLKWVHRRDAQGNLLPNSALRDLAARSLNTHEQVWYVSFSPKEEFTVGPVTFPAGDSMGVLALRVAYEQIPGQSGWHYTVTLTSRVELANAQGVIAATPDDFAWRVTYDPLRQLVYLAAGPKGVGVFDVGPDPFVPVQIGHRDLAGSGEIVSTYECLPDASGRLIVTCAENGVAVFEDATNVTTGDVTLHVTRMVAAGIAPDPTDTTATKYIVCDSAAVSKVVIP